MSEMIIEYAPDVFAEMLKLNVRKIAPGVYYWWLSEADLWDMSERIGDDGQ